MKLFEHFLYYRPDEKRGVVLLCVLIVLALGGIMLMRHNNSDKTNGQFDEKAQAFAEQLRDKSKDSVQPRRTYVYHDTVYLHSDGQKRRNNGTARRWRRDSLHNNHSKTHSGSLESGRDTASLLLPQASVYERIEKYAKGTVVDLNAADTTELRKIPGIGSAIARRIVNYRKRLGGFYSVKQLREAGLNDSLLAGWFSIDTAAIERIDVNQSSVERLQRHPYINFYQAKAMVEYRRKHGDLRSLKPFILYEEFAEDDLQRMAHYLKFAAE